jgi:hypothetical protein
MSGAKCARITISQEEYQRMQNELISRENEINELKSRFQNDLINDLSNQTHLKEIFNLQQTVMNDEISSLKSDLSEIEKRNQEIIRKNQEDFRKLSKRLSKGIEKNDQKIKSFKEEVNESLSSQRKELLNLDKERRNEIKKLDLEITAIKNKDAKKKNIVAKRYSDLMKIIESVGNGFPHEKYAPGELDQLRNKATDIESDLNSDLDVNAMIWDLYYSVNDLRNNIITKQIEFENEFLFAINYLNILLETSKNDELEIEVKDKKHKQIDFWTNGEFSGITKELNRLKSLLEKKNDPDFTIDELREVIRKITITEENQKNVIELAIKNVVASKERLSIAKDIAIKMREAGYEVVDGNGYVGNDPREDYMIHLKHNKLQGCTETTAIISPVISEEGIENSLLLNTNGYFRDRNGISQQTKLVLEALTGRHGNVSGIETQTDEHFKELVGEQVKELLKEGKKLPSEVLKMLKK